MQTIINALNEVFAKFDQDYIEQSRKWAAETAMKLREYKRSELAKLARVNQKEFYETCFAMCGGKTFYQAFDGASLEMVDAWIVKNCNATIAKRNASIASKLLKVGIKSVLSQSLALSENGFDGYFRVETDQGERLISISTVFAGGYNVQRLHQRTLVKIK